MPNLRDLPLDRFTNFVWWWTTRNSTDEAALARFKATLWRPPPGITVSEGPWSPAEEAKGFAALKAQLGK